MAQLVASAYLLPYFFAVFVILDANVCVLSSLFASLQSLYSFCFSGSFRFYSHFLRNKKRDAPAKHLICNK